MARKILLADDSVTAQNMGRKILADAGYEVITVNNGSAALKKIAELKPDLIVLDVYMPGYSGLEVCQRLKEAQETSRVPVLLTVGKLEPFKPEEAKRARADGFIVKPFEASELLSALSKLEDKIVPRPEASKPGRFARVSASIEEGRYDKTVAIEEDMGWKDRIGFPSKKKGKAAKEEEDESEIYNSMNKDLRTVVERKSTEKPHEAKAEETRVDLGALAPEGLPKDVTPEEIAALAAAAAQVQSKSAEAKVAEAKIEDSRHGVPAPAPAQMEQTKQNEQGAELAQPVAEVPGTATPAPVATFADQKPEEKIEETSTEQIEPKSAEKLEAPKEAASTGAPSTAEVIAAIAGLELDSITSTSPVTTAENGSWASSSSSAVGQSADEPVTMAMAAGAASGGGLSRWTAVSVALAPEEAAISLEQEMQKAYAAFAAADAAHAGFDTAPPELQPAASEPVVAVPATPAPEGAQSLSAVASAATEAFTEAAKELEAVATSFVEQETQKTPTPEQFEPAPAGKVEASAQPTAEQTTDRTTEQSGEQTPVIAASEPETAKLETAHQEASEPAHAEDPNQQSNDAAPAPELASAPSAPEQVSATADAMPETTTPAVVDEVPAEQIPAPASDVSEISASAATAPVPAKGEPRDESDIAATTAAAWASWRRIRESGTPQSHTEVEDSAPGSQDEAARAVAAGAEETPQAPGDSEGIADIVDSVLADLRPKIYEEITRKMGKKK